MAFKMKAGKEGPMRKNFGKDISPMNKPLVGNQKNLPDHLKQKILDSPAKLKNGALKKDRKITTKLNQKVSDDLSVDLSTGEVKSKKQTAARNRIKAQKMLRQREVDKAFSSNYQKDPAVKRDQRLKEIKLTRENLKKSGKKSPNKFLGKALGGGLGKVVGKVGKFAKKNPALAGMALGGPLGGLAGGLIGAMKKVKNTKAEKDHNKAARKTEGSRLRQAIRRKFGKNRPKKS